MRYVRIEVKINKIIRSLFIKTSMMFNI